MICHEYATIHHASHTIKNKRINIIKYSTNNHHHQSKLIPLLWLLYFIKFNHDINLKLSIFLLKKLIIKLVIS